MFPDDAIAEQWFIEQRWRQRSALPELWLCERSIRRGAQDDVAPLPGLPQVVLREDRNGYAIL